MRVTVMKTLHQRRHSRGFTLIELMIAVTIGLLILATVTTIFVNNNQARLETERFSQQIENGRYAIQVLTEDFRHAGYLAEYIPPSSLPSTFSAKPDPCETIAANLSSTAAPAFLLHIQGYDNGASAPTCLSGADVKSGTDIVVIRRASTCVAGATGCDAAVGNGLYFQSSLCNPPVSGGAAPAGTQLSSTDTNCPLCADYFRLNTPANLTLNKRNCNTTADIRSYITRIYFVANNSNAGDGIPTLKRLELGPAGWTVVPLVEGIEDMQLEYGVDTNGDGAPENYVADPEVATAPASSCGPTVAGAPPKGVCNWYNTMSVNVHLLARNTQPSQDYTDTKTYSLGLKADGTENVAGPFNDRYRRHAYETMVRLTNPSARRQP